MPDADDPDLPFLPAGAADLGSPGYTGSVGPPRYDAGMAILIAAMLLGAPLWALVLLAGLREIERWARDQREAVLREIREREGEERIAAEIAGVEERAVRDMWRGP